MFFFGDAQLTREAEGGSILENSSPYTSVPTAANRVGNLSDYLAYGSQYQIYDPATGNPTTGVGRVPFNGNIIPASRITSQAAALLSYFPAPNTSSIPGADFANNFIENGNTAITGNQWDTREDYYINPVEHPLRSL